MSAKDKNRGGARQIVQEYRKISNIENAEKLRLSGTNQKEDTYEDSGCSAYKVKFTETAAQEHPAYCRQTVVLAPVQLIAPGERY